MMKKTIDKLFQEATDNLNTLILTEKGRQQLELIAQLKNLSETPEETEQRLIKFRQIVNG